MAEFEPLLHAWPAEIMDAVPQARGLINLDVILDRKRRGGGRIQDPHLSRYQLYLTGWQLRVDGLCTPACYPPTRGNDVLWTAHTSLRMRGRRERRIADDLYQSGAIA
jgi:hypothetical protein